MYFILKVLLKVTFLPVKPEGQEISDEEVVCYLPRLVLRAFVIIKDAHAH